MLLVDTELRPSPIHGLGCFAKSLIKKGEVIWRLTPGFDVIWTPAQWSALPTWQRVKYLEHAYLDNKLLFWVYCSDDARFFNHSTSPSVTTMNSLTDAAARDIEAGEELTCNYYSFCAEPLGTNIL